jgi:tRNA threonylcarbamoyladenosine biosynthesis protein TsaE
MAGSLTELVSASPAETEALGERIGRQLGSGSVVALRGELGSGKTCLAKGIARALGVAENVTSPTYTIINEYRCTARGTSAPPFYHIDAWRLAGDEDFDGIGGPELIAGGVSVIEWSERIPCSLPESAVTVCIEITGEASRKITVSGLYQELP